MGSERSRDWHSRQAEGHGLRMVIGELARAAAAPGWARLVVRRAQVGAHALTTVTRDDHEIAAQGMDEPFQRLRELSYQAGGGTWFICELEFSSGGRGYTGRVDSSAPPFEDVPPVAALAELTAFPREDPPGWLLAALPTAVPFGLPTTYGDHYDRWRHRPGNHRPLPIAGELAYLPATTMTARDFGESREPGGHLVYLTEQADDLEHGHLMLSCHREAYWVGRHDLRGAREGVRSVTLNGAVLRLELTPGAADALETETVFEVRLDLPPKTIGQLRSALADLFRSAVRAPELIGF
ncbi:hypothetical protein GCM10010156_05960 [Planobispora rosea]|uniref:Uncharacterized protein n=1 Tax=Planobispora rosea TaxID=35762 RepID=A0A8J3RYZ0_PLARO|nr:hypothetical protein [Planobispora rosea]GGS50050.1 hypothetical protein GCM10010156_05960 [Planobispora rosea]GIH83880.1 hypothetical protein Pro02_22880 [Planobispora rosea]